MAGVFQTNVFQNDVFQVDTGTGGSCLFQPNVFQLNVFQNCGGVTPPVTPVVPPQVGGIGRRRRHKITVEIDGEEFEVTSIEQGRELLLQARAMAEQAAAVAAEAAAAKAARRSKPAAVDRALAIPVPRIVLQGPDGSELLMQQLRASVDAAQAQIEAIYAQAMLAARIRYAEMLEDEEDVATLLLLS